MTITGAEPQTQSQSPTISEPSIFAYRAAPDHSSSGRSLTQPTPTIQVNFSDGSPTQSYEASIKIYPIDDPVTPVRTMTRTLTESSSIQWDGSTGTDDDPGPSAPYGVYCYTVHVKDVEPGWELDGSGNWARTDMSEGAGGESSVSGMVRGSDYSNVAFSAIDEDVRESPIKVAYVSATQTDEPQGGSIPFRVSYQLHDSSDKGTEQCLDGDIQVIGPDMQTAAHVFLSSRRLDTDYNADISVDNHGPGAYCFTLCGLDRGYTSKNGQHRRILDRGCKVEMPPDTTPPTIEISAPSISLTGTTPVQYTIDYGHADVITLSAGDITLEKAGDVDCSVSVSGTGYMTRTITIDDITGDGTVAISIAANTAHDAAGNQAPAIGPSLLFIADTSATEPPSITISPPSASATTTDPITYTVAYDHADYITLAPTDISLQTTGTASGSIHNDGVTGDGGARTVTVSDIMGNGTIAISIAAGTASNPIGYAPAVGPSTAFDVNNEDLVVPAISPPSSAWAQAGPVVYTLTYYGATEITLDSDDITLNKTGTADASSVVVYGTGSTIRTVTISGITGDGTIGVSIAAGTANDGSGHVAPAFGPSLTFGVDSTPPLWRDCYATPSKWTSASSVRVVMAAQDLESGISHYEVSVDNPSGPFTAQPAVDDFDTAGLSDGEHVLYARAVNNAGGAASRSSTVRIDRTPPLPFTPVADPEDWTNHEFKITYETTDAASGVDHYEVQTRPGRQLLLLPVAKSLLDDRVLRWGTPGGGQGYRQGREHADGTGDPQGRSHAALRLHRYCQSIRLHQGKHHQHTPRGQRCGSGHQVLHAGRPMLQLQGARAGGDNLSKPEWLSLLRRLLHEVRSALPTASTICTPGPSIRHIM